MTNWGEGVPSLAAALGWLLGGTRALPQDVPELRLERGERFHQRGGIELPGDAGRQLVCGVIGKMSPVCFPIQHGAAPSQLAMQDRSAAVKVGLVSRRFTQGRFQGMSYL